MVTPTHIKWNEEVWGITQILDYGVGGNIENLQVATLLRSRGWEPTLFCTKRGPFLRCLVKGEFYPYLHSSAAPGWVEKAR